MISGFLDRYSAFVLKHRWLVVGIATFVMLVLTMGAVNIGVTNDHRVLFDEDDPQLLALEELDQTYAESNTALVAIAPSNGLVFTGETLGVVERLTEAAWHLPYSTRVDSLTNFSYSESEGDDLNVGPLVEDASELGEQEVARLERTALSLTEIVGRLVSHDGRVAAIVVDFALPDEPDAAVAEITNELRSLIAKVGAEHPDIGLYMTGELLMNQAFADATRDDMEQLTPIVFLVILIMTLVLLRSLLATVAVLGLLVFTINTTMGFAGWIGTVFNPVNAGVPIIVLTIAVADSIHIATTVLARLKQGLTRTEAITESLRVNAQPVFLTSVTTAMAFLTLNASESPPFHVLGNMVAFGVGCAFVYSMTLLPALLSILPLRASSNRTVKQAFFTRFADFVIGRRRILLWSVALVALALVTGVWRIEFTDNWTTYFDDRYQFRRDTDFVIENLTGIESWEFSLESGREGGITEPAYLRKVEAFAEWLRGQDEVSHVEAFSDIMKRLNMNMHGDDPAFYQLPNDASLAAQYLLLYELSLPFGKDLNDRISVAKSSTRLTAAARGGLSAAQQREFDARAKDWLRTNAPSLASESTGFTIAFARLSQRNIESMLKATILAMGGISLVLMLVLKSWRIGLISLVPNYVPAAMSFGVWGHLVGQVGLAGSVMTAIAFGIIVDDTTHFLTKYQRARLGGASSPDAVRFAFNATGQALWTTTAVLATGFLVFSLSGFQVSWVLGIMVALTILVALIADFLLLPPLLMAFDRSKGGGDSDSQRLSFSERDSLSGTLGRAELK